MSCLFDTCRICMQRCNIESMRKIFENNVVDDIEKLIGVKLPTSDLLPDKICTKCVSNLDIAMSFYQLCNKSLKHFDAIRQNADLNQPISNEEDHSKLRNIGNKINLDKDFSNNADTEHISDENNKDCVVEKKKNVISRNLQKSSRIKKIYKKIKSQLICDICGNTFKKNQHFLLHVKRHNDEKTFECEICHKRFFTNSELNRHMRSHTGEKPFECKFCHRKFSDCSTQIKHERTHTNERPFTCPQCGKGFTCSYILKNHLLIHTGERAYKCTLCNKSFQRDQHLRTHYKSIMHQQNAESAKK